MLDGRSALIFTGFEIPRTALSVCYPFRPSSHSLYFGGVLPPASAILITPLESVLYAHQPSLTEQIWGGNGTSLSELAELRGFDRVESIEVLLREVPRFEKGELLSVSLLLPEASQFQEALLGRKISAESEDRILYQAIIELRLRHDEFAREELRHVARVTAQAHARAREVADVGVSTNVVLAALREVTAAHGFTESFEPIVSPHGEILHNSRRGEILHDGDLLLVDYGAESDQGYAGDLTRTWPIGNSQHPLALEIYAQLKRIHSELVTMVRPHEEYRRIHETAGLELLKALRSLDIVRGDPQTLFERGLHTLFFPHGIGHLIGLDVHDMEDFGDLASYEPGRTRSERFGDSFLRLDRKLQSNMLVSIEPGVYFIPAILNGELGAKFRDSIHQELIPTLLQIRGIRIEDAVLVTESGYENLTGDVTKEWT